MAQMNSDKGYVIALAEDSDFYIAGALHIERDDNIIPWKFSDDVEAAKAAERDGIKLVYGMDSIEDGVYLDTPDNWRVLENALIERNRKPSILETMKQYHEKIAAEPRSPERPRPTSRER